MSRQVTANITIRFSALTAHCFIGLAFSASGDMVVATNEDVYRLPLGIRGILI